MIALFWLMNKHILTVLILGGYYSFLAASAYTFNKLFQTHRHMGTSLSVIEQPSTRVVSDR